MKTTNMSANQAAFADEISLRDLYLIFKKGFPWIILTGLLVGVITFVYLGMQPRKYVAESSTIVTPIVGRPTFNVGGENLKVEGGGSIPFNTYKALAKSRQVVEATMTRVPQFEGDIASLERAMGLSVLVGPDKDNQSGPLAVVHRISNTSPTLAAELADAWAEASLEVVRAALLDDLDPISQTTNAAFDAAEINLIEAERQLREFESQNNLSVMETELSSINDFLGRAEQNIMQLDANLAVEQALLETYGRQLTEELAVLNVSNSQSLDVFAGMTLADAIAFVQEEREKHEANYHATTIALGDFDKTHDIDLVAEQERKIRQLIADNQVSLITTEESLASDRVRLEWQLAELAKHPERNVFTQALLDNPLLAEGLRQTDGSINLSTAEGLIVQVDELNPQHASLLSDVLQTELRIAEFEAKHDILVDSIANLSSQADTLRSTRVDDGIERARLSAERDNAKILFDMYSEFAVSLAVFGERPEYDNKMLGLTRSTVAQLRANMRDSEQRIVRLEAELSQVFADQRKLTERAAELQSDIAAFNFERRSLERYVSQQRDAYNGVARLQPIMELFGELAPGNARVLNPAVVPESAEGGRLQPTVIAAIVGGLLATMFIFLREAIRDPNEVIARPRATTAATTGN